MCETKCCNECGSFFTDMSDFETDLGVCLMDEEFEPYIDDIIEESKFDTCYELYKAKRFDGNNSACENFEEIEMLEISDEEDIYGYLLVESLKHKDVSDILEKFTSSNVSEINDSVNQLSKYVYIGNIDAYQGLFDYYAKLSSADTLDEVHLRVKIVEMLSDRETNKEIIDVLVKELERTPSNNTTRQLYTKIFNVLSKCPLELIEKPIINLISTNKFSYKIEKRLNEVMEIATYRNINL